jgi:K+-sensing histidine kinase KdpD
LRQSEKLKSALLDAVTHDLRTPLTSIKASITTLLDEVRGGELPATLDRDSRVEMMEVIDEESDRLSRFINGLIELARIEAGELQLLRRWGAVDEIISTALQRAEPITRNHRVELQVEKELPGVRVDERAVSEVVYTLIDNAAKYSPKGSTIRLIARRKKFQRHHHRRPPRIHPRAVVATLPPQPELTIVERLAALQERRNRHQRPLPSRTLATPVEAL